MSGQITNSGDDFDFSGAKLTNLADGVASSDAATVGQLGSGGAIPSAIMDAKGDLITATAADTPARQAVGSNDQVLIADSAQTNGIKWAQVGEAMIALADVTTLDVSTTKHGLVPKAPNDAAKFLRGDATWATIGGTGTALVASDPIWDAKGDLAAATGADAATRLAVGANDTVLTADSAQSTGIKWAAIPAAVPLSTIDAKGDLLAGTANDAIDNLTVGSNGKLLVADSGETTGLMWETGYLGGLELVYRYTVTGSVKASIDTGVDSPDAGTNDWANGDILEIFIYARCDNAATTQTVSLTFNNDTSAVYDRTFLNNTNTTVTGNNSMAQTSGILGVAGDNASTGTFTTLCLWMHNYTGTVGNKQMNTLGGTLGQTAATATITNQNFTWRPASPAAVSRLKIIPSSGNFKIGTQLLIYKRRNA